MICDKCGAEMRTNDGWEGNVWVEGYECPSCENVIETARLNNDEEC